MRPAQVEVLIDDEELFDPVPVQDFLRLLKSGSHRDCNEVIPGHDFRNRSLHVALEA